MKYIVSCLVLLISLSGPVLAQTHKKNKPHKKVASQVSTQSVISDKYYHYEYFFYYYNYPYCYNFCNPYSVPFFYPYNQYWTW